MELFRKKDSRFYWYDFKVRARRYRDSTKETYKKRAGRIAVLRLSQALSGAGLLDHKAPSLQELSVQFLRPELRAHYDTLLANPATPAVFPYGGRGSILVAGNRSRSGETFFARRILAFVPDRTHRRFHLPVRNCEFYADRASYRDVRRKLQFWLDPALLHVSWDPSWNRWKHLLSSKLEVDGVFVRSGKYKKRDGEWKIVDWETGLPSRLSVKLPTDFEQEIERARNMYSRFGQYSRALDQVRLCLEHKAIERKDLERICSELGISNDFDIAQISWRPDYDPFFHRELSRCARRMYLFHSEYIFELENAVLVETPQLGHATYVFAKPRDMDNFLALYIKTTKANIRGNQENVAERLGFVRRVVHGTNPILWLNEMREYLGEREKPIAWERRTNLIRSNQTALAVCSSEQLRRNR